VFQQQTEHAVTKTARWTLSEQLAAGSFEQLPILNAGRTHLFAGAAAKASIDVPFKCGRVVTEPALTDRAHQVESTTWSIVFITCNDVGGTGFQAQPTVNAGEQLLFLSGTL
jgi:hypothetical protein